jgi:hypothetical protein
VKYRYINGEIRVEMVDGQDVREELRTGRGTGVRMDRVREVTMDKAGVMGLWPGGLTRWWKSYGQGEGSEVR